MTRTSLAVLILVAICAALGAVVVVTMERTRAAAPPPNIVLVLTDDQAYRSTVKRMPWLHRHRRDFARFTHAYANNPLCCPARATILTGLYSHRTQVEDNSDGEKLDPGSTIATWLDGAGYETGLFGKYLNGYPFKGEPLVPAGWDRFSPFTTQAKYYDYKLLTGDHSKRYGSRHQDYSTRVIARRAGRFIRAAQPPFFAYVAPYGPHRRRSSELATPDFRDRHLFRHAQVELPSNFNRAAKGAPRWWKRLPPVSRRLVRQTMRAAWATLRSEDRLLRNLVRSLRRKGQLGRTIIVFASDNGYSFGSHRWIYKGCAYEECIHVPLMIRAPGVPARTVRAMVGNQDIAPTLAALAGVEHPPVDGRSLVPLIRGRGSGHAMLLHTEGMVPPYWGLRTKRWKFVKHKSGARELYRLSDDPGELQNLADREHRRVMRRLGERLARLRH